MNIYQGEFNEHDQDYLNSLFDGWYFKHVGRSATTMEYFYASKGQYRAVGRTIDILVQNMIDAGMDDV